MAICNLEEDLTVTERNRRRILELVRIFQGKSDRGASLIKVMDEMSRGGLPKPEFPHYLISLMREGLLFPVDEEHVRTAR